MALRPLPTPDVAGVEDTTRLITKDWHDYFRQLDNIIRALAGEIGSSGDGSFASGLWTPSLSFSTGTITTATYTSLRHGAYMKIGKWVWVSFQFSLSTFDKGTSGGYMRVLGIPYPIRPAGTGEGFGVLQYYGINIPAGFTQCSMDALGGSSELVGVKVGPGAKYDSILAAEFGPFGAVPDPFGNVLTLQSSLGYFTT